MTTLTNEKFLFSQNTLRPYGEKTKQVIPNMPLEKLFPCGYWDFLIALQIIIGMSRKKYNVRLFLKTYRQE